MQIWFLLALALTAVLITLTFRYRRDRELLADKVRELGGEVVRMRRVRRGSPFPDTTRGWWAWRIHWRNASGERASWALTSREGLKEWRDD